MSPPSPLLGILIVDDQREVRRMIRAALESLFPHASIQDVPSAEEAMILLSQEMFQLLVVDVRLAGMSGLEMVEKARRRQPDLNIVVITGINEPRIDQQLKEAPIQAWFRKPLPMDEFLSCVSGLLGQPAEHLTSPEPTPLSVVERQAQERAIDPLGALCEREGLLGLWITDQPGNLLAQAVLSSPSFKFPHVLEFFAQLEGAIKRSQTAYGAEQFPQLCFYLTADEVVSQLHLEELKILFCVERRKCPSQSVALQMAIVQKGQQLLEDFRGDPSLKQVLFSLNSSPVQETVEDTVPPDASLEALLENPSLELNEPHEVDAFWEQGLATEDWSNLDNAQTLHFHQARQQGLISADEAEDSPKG